MDPAVAAEDPPPKEDPKTAGQAGEPRTGPEAQPPTGGWKTRVWGPIAALTTAMAFGRTMAARRRR